MRFYKHTITNQQQYVHKPGIFVLILTDAAR